MKKKLIVMTTMIFLSSCAPAKPSKLEFNENVNMRTPVSQLPQGVSFKEVSDQVLAPLNCLQCHGDMKTAAGLQSYLKAGEPFDSKVYLRMENQTMPPFGPKADKEQLELLESYIRELAI